MDLKILEKAPREAERELDAATTRTALAAAAKKFMRANAELKRLQAELSAYSGVEWGATGGRRRSARVCSSTSNPIP